MGVETPKIILGGDKTKAYGWLGFARQKLSLHKFIQAQARIMDGLQGLKGVQGVNGVHGNSAIINRMYKPIKGTKVLIKSHDGHDYIKIHVEGGVGCSVAIKAEDLGGLEVKLTIKYIPRTGDTLPRGWASVIKWGDGEEYFQTGLAGQERFRTKTYESAGDYTVTVKAWNVKLLDSGLSPTSPMTASGYVKHGDEVFTNEADAWANMMAKPWALVNAATKDFAGISIGNRSRCAYFVTGRAFPSYEYAAERAVLDIDLSEQKNKVKLIGIVSVISSGRNPIADRHIGVYKNGTLYGEIAPAQRPPAELTRYLELGDVSELTQIDLKDDDNYSFQAGTGAVKMVTNGDNHTALFLPYDCLAQKKKKVTVE